MKVEFGFIRILYRGRFLKVFYEYLLGLFRKFSKVYIYLVYKFFWWVKNFSELLNLFSFLFQNNFIYEFMGDLDLIFNVIVIRSKI